jgi:hypothetical protein
MYDKNCTITNYLKKKGLKKLSKKIAFFLKKLLSSWLKVVKKLSTSCQKAGKTLVKIRPELEALAENSETVRRRRRGRGRG